MSKILIIPSSIEMIKETDYLCDGYILGIKGLSVNLPIYFEIDDIKHLFNSDKEIFISLNKNMHNSLMDKLNCTLATLDNYNVNVIYYDPCVVNLKKKHHYKFNLVWGQEHLLTNSSTCNFWLNNGVKYGLVSSEITKEQIIEIKKNTEMKLIVPIFGYLPMFTSDRHLVDNYYNYFNLKNKNKIHYMEKENSRYPIVDDEFGTTIYSSNILDGQKEIEELQKNNIDYFVFNSFLIDENVFVKILSNLSNKEEYDELISSLKTDKGFLYKETMDRLQ